MYYNKKRQEVIRKVFPGKAGLYRALIIEGLILDNHSTADLARYITNNAGGNYKNIYSVIDRKEGPLAWLTEKEFIEKQIDGWELSLKGQSVALILCEDLDKVLPLIRQEISKRRNDETRQRFDMMMSMPLFEGIFQPGFIDNLINDFSKGEFWHILKSKTESLVNKGVNVSELSNMEFGQILMPQVFQEAVDKKLLHAFMPKRKQSTE